MEGRERGLILRLCAAVQAVVGLSFLVYALSVPDSFGVSVTVKLLVGGIAVATHAVIAALPWERWMAKRDMRAAAGLHVAVTITGLVIAMVLNGGPGNDLLWGAAVALVYSGVLLPLREHAVATAGVLGAIIITLVWGGRPLPVVPLIALPAMAILSGIATAIVRRARDDDASGRERAERSELALRAVAGSLGESITGDRQKILDAAAQAAGEIRNDMAGVYWLTPDGRHVTYAATVGLPEELRNLMAPIGHGLMGEVQRRCEIVVMTDYQAFDDAMPRYVELGLQAAIGAPIRQHGEIVGMLVGGRRTAGEYSADEIAAFELLATNTERALEMSEQVVADRRVLSHLREIERMKHDFVTTVSHELRTPLTIINGITETLVRHQSSLPDEQMGLLLGRMHTNAESLTAIVKTLLDTAAIDQGILLAHVQPFEATEVIGGAIHRLRGLFSDNHLNMMAPSTISLLGDAGLIERVIDNLIVNAQRHTPAGINVTVRATTHDDDCEIAVIDDGPGIPPEDQQRILKRFERGGDPNARPRGGLGLGLSLCAEILRLHDAELRLTSSPGRTVFAFTLPLAHLTGPLTIPAAPAVPIPSTTGYPMDGAW